MTLAWMFDYAVNGCRIEIEDFYRMFLMSSYARRFETGNCSVVAGLSGVELAQRVIWEYDEQRELAEKADVPLRTIQQYEQKQKNINHARVDYVIRLAQALYCRPDDLMEL